MSWSSTHRCYYDRLGTNHEIISCQLEDCFGRSVHATLLAKPAMTEKVDIRINEVHEFINTMTDRESAQKGVKPFPAKGLRVFPSGRGLFLKSPMLPHIITTASLLRVIPMRITFSDSGKNLLPSLRQEFPVIIMASPLTPSFRQSFSRNPVTGIQSPESSQMIA